MAALLFAVAGTAGADEVRVIGPDDVLEVIVRGEDDLTDKYPVGSNGAITMPLIGEVDLAGLSCEQAAEELAAAFADGFLVDPKVSVSIAESQHAVVFVLGQVKEPGTLPYRRGMTALRAVLEAGNFSKYAARNKTRVVRGEGEEREVIKVKLGDVVGKGELEKDVLLQPGDLVIVPETLF